MKPSLGSIYHRQENPVLQELPESALAGIGVVPLLLTLPDDHTLLIFGLLQALQVTEIISEEVRILSNIFPHLLQENLQIGILPSFKKLILGNLETQIFFCCWITIVT